MAKTGNTTNQLIGWRENVGLPDLGFNSIKAKIDTGARTSALHAGIKRIFDHDNKSHVEFHTYKPTGGRGSTFVLPLVDQRDVKNTSGIPETRCVVKTTLFVGSRHWQIELTLTDRAQMTFDLILGRTAIRTHHLCVHPGQSYLAGPPVYAVKTHS